MRIPFSTSALIGYLQPGKNDCASLGMLRPPWIERGRHRGGSKGWLRCTFSVGLGQDLRMAVLSTRPKVPRGEPRSGGMR